MIADVPAFDVALDDCLDSIEAAARRGNAPMLAQQRARLRDLVDDELYARTSAGERATIGGWLLAFAALVALIATAARMCAS